MYIDPESDKEASGYGWLYGAKFMFLYSEAFLYSDVF